MTVRVWEDLINPAGCDADILEAQRALDEQRRMIAQLRGTDVPPEPVRRDVRQHYGHSVDWPGVRIQALRERLGLSQDRFARRLGIGQCTVSAWERGATRPGYAAIGRLIELDREVNG